MALKFDGNVANYIVQTPTFVGGTDYTIMGWWYQTVTAGNDEGMCYYYLEDSVSWAPECIVDRYGSAYVYANGTASSALSKRVPLNRWTHIAMVRKGTTVTAYFDGKSVGSATNATNLSGSMYAQGINIPAPYWSPTYNVTAKFAGLKIWKRALSMGEINMEMGTFMPANPQLITCCVPFYTPDGSRLVDYSGKKNKPTVTGTLLDTMLNPPIAWSQGSETWWEIEGVTVEYQYARPESDVTDGSWTDQSAGTSLYVAIDEVTASDADYIQSTTDPANDECVIQLSDLATPDAGTRTLRYRYKKDQTGNQINLTVGLYDGNTLIQATTHTNIGTSYVDGALVITNTISTWTDLRVRFKANKV